MGLSNQRMTNEECRQYHLPARSPVEPFEELDWFALQVPEPAESLDEEFEIAAAILGGKRAVTAVA